MNGTAAWHRHRDGDRRRFPRPVYAAATGVLRHYDFFAYESTFRGGVFVAVADLNGDGKADIITGTESGGGPRVRVFSGSTSVLRDFFAFDPNLRAGVHRVAAGDLAGNRPRPTSSPRPARARRLASAP